MTKIAQGICGWEGYERRSNRYGSIHLTASPYGGPDLAKVEFDQNALKALEGKKVRLTCKVVETRESGHAGDAFLKIKPSTPEVGAVIDLGVGTLAISAGYDGNPDIFLKPGDGRPTLWIDPRKLYQLHDQTVEVFAEETTEAFSPAPDIRVNDEEGAIDNGDGSFQMKTTQDSLHVQPNFERIGDGLFALHLPGSGPAGTRYNARRRG